MNEDGLGKGNPDCWCEILLEHCRISGRVLDRPHGQLKKGRQTSVYTNFRALEEHSGRQIWTSYVLTMYFTYKSLCIDIPCDTPWYILILYIYVYIYTYYCCCAGVDVEISGARQSQCKHVRNWIPLFGSYPAVEPPKRSVSRGNHVEPLLRVVFGCPWTLQLVSH